MCERLGREVKRRRGIFMCKQLLGAVGHVCFFVNLSSAAFRLEAGALPPLLLISLQAQPQGVQVFLLQLQRPLRRSSWRLLPLYRGCGR